MHGNFSTSLRCCSPYFPLGLLKFCHAYRNFSLKKLKTIFALEKAEMSIQRYVAEKCSIMTKSYRAFIEPEEEHTLLFYGFMDGRLFNIHWGNDFSV